jgi:hypothetical protein
MEGNGILYKPNKLGSFTLSHGPLESIEQQQIVRELNPSMPRLGDIWVPIEVEIKSCCV